MILARLIAAVVVAIIIAACAGGDEGDIDIACELTAQMFQDAIGTLEPPLTEAERTAFREAATEAFPPRYTALTDAIEAAATAEESEELGEEMVRMLAGDCDQPIYQELLSQIEDRQNQTQQRLDDAIRRASRNEANR